MSASDRDDPHAPARPAASVPAGGWLEALGLELVHVSRELVVAQWDVEARHLQPHGIVHGGVHASVVETCCSLGAQLACPAGKVPVGMENHTSFLRPVRSGRLSARAVPVQAGKRAQLWECSVTDAAGRLVATGRLRLLCVDAEGEK